MLNDWNLDNLSSETDVFVVSETWHLELLFKVGNTRNTEKKMIRSTVLAARGYFTLHDDRCIRKSNEVPLIQHRLEAVNYSTGIAVRCQW